MPLPPQNPIQSELIAQGVENWAQNGNAHADATSDPYSSLYDTINKNYMQYLTSPAAQILTPAIQAPNPQGAALEDIREAGGKTGQPGIGSVQTAAQGIIQGLAQGLQGAYAGMGGGPGMGGAGALDYAKFMQSAKEQNMKKDTDTQAATAKVNTDEILAPQLKAIASFNTFKNQWNDIANAKGNYSRPQVANLMDTLLQMEKPGQRLFNDQGQPLPGAESLAVGLFAAFAPILKKLSSSTDLPDAGELNAIKRVGETLNKSAIENAQKRISELEEQDQGQTIRPNYGVIKNQLQDSNVNLKDVDEKEVQAASQARANALAKQNFITGIATGEQKLANGHTVFKGHEYDAKGNLIK